MRDVGEGRRLATVTLLLIALALWGGCRSPIGSAAGYRYFAEPSVDDAWSPKIRGWQDRERRSAGGDSPASVAHAGKRAPEGEGAGDLRAKYDSFRIERRRALAREVADWTQEQAQLHYRADGPIDHWATLEETFRSNGDDCDGLELIAFNFLRDLGFSQDEVFRAIVVRRADGQHHMVTLWFEDPEDPWVIDPTGAMTQGMPRMSEMPEWVPLKLFTENRDYTVLDALHAAQR